MRLKKPIVATTAVAMLALAACGGGGSDEPNNADDATFKTGGEAGKIIDPNRQAPAPEVEGAETGGIITALSSAGITTMDPTEAYYTNSLNILQHLVTRSLTQYAFNEETGGMVLVPDLATDTGTPNEDYTEWKFTIREGVKFENGQPVTADDVAYGIMRSFDRDTFPGGPSYSNDYMLDGDKYKGPYKSGTDYKGVVVKGNELTIKMARPFPDMAYYGAFPAISPIPEKGSEPADYALHPLATGPYKFDKYEPGESLTLVKNDQWDAATDPARHQYVDGFEFRFTEIDKQADAILLSDTGEGQTSVLDQSVLAGDYRKAQEQAQDRLVPGSIPCTSFFYPDYREIKELEVRQAIGYAYPYQDNWTAAGEIIGVTRIPGTSILPPGVVGRPDYNPLDIEPGETDPEKAKQLLADAGYKPGEYELKFLYATDDPTSVDVKDQLVAGLEAGGFKATPVASTINEIPTQIADPDFRKVNVRASSWCSDWPSGGSWFPALFSGGGSNNYAYFKEPAVDKEIDRILSLPVEEQGAAWGELDQMIMNEYYPAVNRGYLGVMMMRGSRIGGMNNDETLGAPTYKDMYVIPE